ncbi:MAG: hypothetical protein ACYTBP_14515, partial [Planctomycetota bacterium]
IVGWGDNQYGQANSPDGNDFIAIAVGYWHSLALKADGSIVGWGWNWCGQATPPDGNDYVAIAAGNNNSLAIKEIIPNMIEVEMDFTPKTISCKSKGNWLKAHITLPGDLTADDVDLTEPAILEPVGIESEEIRIIGGDHGPVKLEIAFDRSVFCESIIGEGPFELTVIVSLTDGDYFTVTDTVMIKGGR